ncbi:MAG: hydantoinase/oxoprolinase family protein [Alphaproteobacteria bacterium]|nr:hydantoinase/oxoprolinase family protein [Alphaproteobacteria bacterium]
MGAIAGIDVGGTFTDLILVDAEGQVRIAKVLTTVDNQAGGVMAAIAESGLAPAAIDTIVHGTTTTTNALLERKIAKVGLLTTKGFRDVLELGRRTRPTSYGLTGRFVPLIDRPLRLEVAERIDAEGRVVTPLDPAEVKAQLERLVKAGAESLVIHFLHAYANPAHERKAAEIADRHWPNEHITMASGVLSEYREYERGVTAAVNAAVQPVLRRYLGRLADELAAGGHRRDLLVMQGNGGTVSARIVAESAVNTVMSGPASGVIAAAATGLASGHPNLITYDMGGTSSDVGLIRDGVPAVSSELELEYAMPIHVPMVDMHSIGAGGGSIAAIDDGGMLRVGPQSAGARPGPICYGRGGERPTITDANLALGRLDPAGLLKVDNPVPLERVREIVLRTVGAPLGLDADGAAAAILRIANDRMAGAIRMVSLARGHDPRDFALFAFGGAGPLHAAALARELGIPTVLVPARPGLTNALGCLVADLRHDFVNTVNRPVAGLDMAEVARIVSGQIAAGRELIEREGVAIERLEYLHFADMQFMGQSHLLTIPISGPAVTREALQGDFERAYWERFQVELPEIRAVLVNLHTAAIGRRRPPDLALLAPDRERKPDLAQAMRGRRQVWFEQGGWQDTPIYRRDWLPRAARFEGPAIVEQLDSTVAIEPGNRAALDRLGNLILTVQPAEGAAP